MLNRQIRDAEGKLHKFGQSNPRGERLLTVTVVGMVFALVVALEVEDISRFGPLRNCNRIRIWGLRPMVWEEKISMRNFGLM